MSYFVLLTDGSKFGPADLTLLQEWIDEGGLLPSAQLEDESTGGVLSAADVEGLRFPEASIKKLGKLVKEAQRESDIEGLNVRSGWLMILLGPIVCGFGACVPWGLIATPIMPLAALMYAKRLPPSRELTAKRIRMAAWVELVGAVILAAGLIFLIESGRMPLPQK